MQWGGRCADIFRSLPFLRGYVKIEPRENLYRKSIKKNLYKEEATMNREQAHDILMKYMKVIRICFQTERYLYHGLIRNPAISIRLTPL